MRHIKELRKELRMHQLEQKWLKAKIAELKAYSTSNRDKLKLIKREILEAKRIK